LNNVECGCIVLNAHCFEEGFQKNQAIAAYNTEQTKNYIKLYMVPVCCQKMKIIQEKTII